MIDDVEMSEIIRFLEDKPISINREWYLHATSKDISIIQKILQEGIKSAYLRGKKGNHFNGKYYVSLCKYEPDQDVYKRIQDHPKFIIEGITPYYADRSKLKMRRMFINTRFHLEPVNGMGSTNII